jgi:hypothetical protein
VIGQYLKRFFKSLGASRIISLQRAYFILQFARKVLEIFQTLPEGRNVITAPTMALPAPPSSSHNVLFVGAPVKMRETPELAESDAFIP